MCLPMSISSQTAIGKKHVCTYRTHWTPFFLGQEHIFGNFHRPLSSRDERPRGEVLQAIRAQGAREPI